MRLTLVFALQAQPTCFPIGISGLVLAPRQGVAYARVCAYDLNIAGWYPAARTCYPRARISKSIAGANVVTGTRISPCWNNCRVSTFCSSAALCPPRTRAWILALPSVVLDVRPRTGL